MLRRRNKHLGADGVCPRASPDAVLVVDEHLFAAGRVQAKDLESVFARRRRSRPFWNVCASTASHSPASASTATAAASAVARVLPTRGAQYLRRFFGPGRRRDRVCVRVCRWPCQRRSWHRQV